MNLTLPKKYFLFGLPVLLLLSTAVVFTFLSQWLNKELGYVLGFVFYYSVWCISVPLIYLGKDGILSLFKEEVPLFKKENWLLIILLLSITAGAVVMYFSGFINAPVLLITIAVPAAIINGIFEEILWRGLYIKAFPKKLFSGFIYPSIGFAIWHISPQLIFPSKTGLFAFVGSAFFLGLGYGWIAYKTSSIKWTAISHSVNGIIALGGYIAPSILKLILS
ncbi:MAG: CPBP family intramembrane metalloprotease [Spirochaetes bacterium]|nr:CPBP family intramembrane metalloprotease [Spirochaetota bacterium]